MDASEPPMSTAPRTTESMLGRGPRSRKRPSREELLAKSAEVERVSSSTATSKELSFNSRNLNSGNFLAPTTTETYDCLPTMDYVPVKKDADGNYVTENAPACSYSELTPQARCYSNNNCFYLWLGKFRYTNVWCISK